MNQTKQPDNNLRLDVDAVLKEKMPRHYRFIPRFVVNKLKKTICQDQLNELISNNQQYKDADFCRGVLKDLGISCSVLGKENINPENRRVTIVSNHPLGGLDGLAMISTFSDIYGGALHFPVNDILMHIKPLDGVFLPINKHGGQSRDALRLTDEAFKSDDPMIIFPAGLCSRRQKSGQIHDLEWKKMFITKSKEYNRDIVPVFFDGRNSDFFYRVAQWRKRLRIKFNIEMLYLPSEIFKNRNAQFRIAIGEPISHSNLFSGIAAKNQAKEIENIVYSIPNIQNSK